MGFECTLKTLNTISQNGIISTSAHGSNNIYGDIAIEFFCNMHQFFRVYYYYFCKKKKKKKNFAVCNYYQNFNFISNNFKERKKGKKYCNYKKLE